MLTTNYIRSNIEIVKEGLKKRNFSDENLSILQEIIDLDDQRKSLQTKLDEQLAEINKMSGQIGKLYKEGNREEADGIKQKVGEIKELSKSLEEESKQTKLALEEKLLSVPNVPHPLVPAGNTDEDNEVYKAWEGDMPDMAENAKPHWEITEKFDIIDFKLGAQLTGSGFPVYKGKGAKLQRALINFFLAEAEKAGYQEIMPPLMVNEATARGTGAIPDKEGQMYHVEKDDLYLIPTAEVPVTNVYAGKIIGSDEFPIKMTGYTPCFRREAGSYGSDVKGLNRLHQFDKVEIVQITHPDKSYETLDKMLLHIEGLLAKLELPYRILRLCGGDLSSTSALTYDFEVFSAAQKRWLEVSSVSNFETYQSNRMKMRYKDENGKTQLVHTLNGSALALPRIVAALLENHQTAEGVNIPEALRSYTGFDKID